MEYKLGRIDDVISVSHLKVDDFDTWGIDYTLCPIILPLLKQLKTTKQGSPYVDVDDVPEELRPTEPSIDCGGADNTHHARWGWVMDEMIWAFEEMNSMCYDDNHVFDYIEDRTLERRIDRGTLLFGKYFRNLWD